MLRWCTLKRRSGALSSSEIPNNGGGNGEGLAVQQRRGTGLILGELWFCGSSSSDLDLDR